MATPDLGHQLTDKELAKLEKRISSVYGEAAKELQKTIDAYFESFAKRDEEMKALIGTVQNGKEWTESDYKQWRLAQIGRGKRFEALRDKLAERMTKANQTAVSYVNDATPGIYSLNRNYAAYTIEQVTGDVGFTMWDEQTVKRLIVEEPDLMPYYPPKRAVKRGIDLAYGKKQITASVTSGILQGKSIKGLADDLQTRIPTMNRDSAIRTARTAVTGAQNAGRIDSYTAAQKMGIELQKEWLATLDSRTRHSHAMLDGEKVDTEKRFSNGCRFPGDPQGRPEEIYNCFVGETQIASDGEVVRSYKHEYDGELIELKTASGVNFTCTPNHPILTPSGWVAAARLNERDNLLVASVGNSVFSRRNPNINHVFPRMDALHEFFDIVFGQRISTLRVNFHGHIPTTDVEVIAHKRLLGNYRDSSIGKRVDEFLLKIANKSFMSKSASMKHLWRVCKSAFCFIRSIRKSLSFLWRGLSHSGIHGFRPAANVDTSMVQPAINDLTADTVFLREFLDGLPFEVFPDNIVRINRIVAKCHVYNLQTTTGHYFVNTSIPQNAEKYNGNFAIAHNCRCTLIASLPDVDTSDTQRRARDPETGKSVLIENMTYQEWAGWKENTRTSSINSAKSVKDVETVFRDRDWFIHGEGELAGWRSDEGLSLDGIDVESAKYVYSTYEQFFDKFPQLKNKLAAPITSKLDVTKYAECTMGFGSGLVNISKGKYANYEKMKINLAKAVHDDWFSSTDMIMHELGHSVDDYLSCNLHLFGVQGKRETDFVSNKVRAKILRESGIKLGDIKNEVSEYATTNAHEWFAECFAEYMTSSSPRKCAKKLGEWIKKQIYGD